MADITPQKIKLSESVSRFKGKTNKHTMAVRSDDLNRTIDAITDGTSTDLKVDTLSVDTINETTSANGVTIDGVLLKDGTITTTSPIINSVDAAITATGTDDTDGYALTEEINIITGGAANTGVELPTAVVGQKIVVANLTASEKNVYANTSDGIDDKTATTGSVILKPEQVVTFYCYTVALWQSDFEADATYDTIYVDTIAEYTSANGVAVDGVTLKDGGVTATGEIVTSSNGDVSDPSVKIGSSDALGIYEVSGTQLGFSVSNALTTIIDDSGISSDRIVSRVAKGTAGTNVSAVEFGDGRNFTTELTLSEVSYSIAGAADEAVGALIYTFPAGAHLLEAAYMSVGLTGGGTVDADTPDIGIGTVIGTGAVSVLGGTAAFEDIIDGQTAADCSGTATVALLTPDDTLSVAGDVKAVYLNIADGWAGADTVTASGTVTLKWTIMS